MTAFAMKGGDTVAKKTYLKSLRVSSDGTISPQVGPLKSGIVPVVSSEGDSIFGYMPIKDLPGKWSKDESIQLLAMALACAHFRQSHHTSVYPYIRRHSHLTGGHVWYARGDLGFPALFGSGTPVPVWKDGVVHKFGCQPTPADPCNCADVSKWSIFMSFAPDPLVGSKFMSAANIPEDVLGQVLKAQYAKAKVAKFGTAYGMSPATIAKEYSPLPPGDLLSVSEVKQKIDEMAKGPSPLSAISTFPGMSKWLDYLEKSGVGQTIPSSPHALKDDDEDALLAKTGLMQLSYAYPFPKIPEDPNAVQTGSFLRLVAKPKDWDFSRWLYSLVAHFWPCNFVSVQYTSSGGYLWAHCYIGSGPAPSHAAPDDPSDAYEMKLSEALEAIDYEEAEGMTAAELWPIVSGDKCPFDPAAVLCAPDDQYAEYTYRLFGSCWTFWGFPLPGCEDATS